MTALVRASVLSALLVAAACGGSADAGPAGPAAPTAPRVPAAPTPLRTLAETRRLHIGVGTAIGSYFNRTDAAGTEYMAVLKREFNVVTPENDLKFSALRPTRATFRFARPDSMLEFATANGMRMRGHTLVWHNQLPSWLTGGTWTQAEGVALLDEHIAAVVGHYKGKIAAWDVVNEAFDDSGVPRTTFWSTLIGPSYIAQAFRSAAAADPGARLFYNDYNIETIGAKSNAVLAMLAELKASGVPVHGVGLQAHFIAGQAPSRDALVANMNRFAALGLAIEITELDIRVPVPASAAALQTQAQNYADVVRACLDVPACDMVVAWGFTDLSSWVPSTFAGQGAALLFDESFQPKPAYTAVNALFAGS